MKIKIILLAILALNLASCKHDHDHDSIDEHDEIKIQLTAYTNEFELFAEADPFMVGETSNVLSHFSNVPSFSALEEGSITFRIVVNGNETIQELEKPTRKGIYSFDIVPKKAGKGQLVFDIKTEEGTFQLTVPDVEVYDNEDHAHEAAELADISFTNSTVFTKEQSWKVDFETGFPIKETFGQIIKTIAQVQPAQGDEVIVLAKTSGILLLKNDHLLEGNTVSKGQVLFTVSGKDFAENNFSVRFSEVKNNFEKSKADFERMQELSKDKIVSEKDLLHAKNQYENDKSAYDMLSRNFNINGQNILSPMAGFVKQLYVKNGQYIEAGQAIVSIAQNKELVLQANVQQKYAPLLSTVRTANIHTLYEKQTYTLEQLNGKVLSYGKGISNNNFLIPVYLQIDNPGSIIPGGLVEVYLKTHSNTQVLTVPNSALVEEQGLYAVFVQLTPELFEKREVKTGVTDGMRTEIVHGITEFERIVTKGAILIKLAQSTGTLDAHSGHVH